ncbi:MAG: amidophosphoribosyltransferase [Alphaproteobacteria bacterium]|nr:amidophosphoribosyltransferase [Alphaproteobacteria bacterium]
MNALPNLPLDKFRDECGIFGIFGHDEASAHTALGLHALQHRGQEACGVVSFDGEHFHTHRGLGLVSDNFNAPHVMTQLRGSAAIGHVRYATTGETILRNVQPLFVDIAGGGLAIAHNGNLTNAVDLRDQLAERGSLFQSTLDTEVIVHLAAVSRFSHMVDRLVDALNRVIGAYALVALTNDGLIGVRDPLGVRPLVIGQMDGATILASETCALDILGATFVRDVAPGELVVIDAAGTHSMRPFRKQAHKFCVFEYIYFARPDSRVEGRSVYELRKRMGVELARENGVPADVVVPVPDSGVPAALGYAAETGLPFDLGIIRNHYVGRTFIEPTDSIRHLGVKLKHNANRAGLEGKRVVLIDDSIVRGTTSIKIVEMVRNAGATEVHMRIASPPTTHSCFYGVDTPRRKELLASRMDVPGMARYIGVDSLAFLSLDGLYRAAHGEARDSSAAQFCDACLTGEYPIPLIDHDGGTAARQLSLLEDHG